jgi:hypothetical protein
MAEPAVRLDRRTERTAAPPQRRAAERARRLRHVRRRRRDLLEDAVLAFVLAITLFTLTAGLGVVALLAGALSAVVIGSFIWERRRARRRPAHSSRRAARR